MNQFFQTAVAKLRYWQNLLVVTFGLWVLRRLVMLGLRFGDVRTIKGIAADLRELGQKTETGEMIEAADFIDEKAEQIVLQRNESWR